MSKLDIEKYKERLLKEQQQLEEDLSLVGRINPSDPEDWEAVADDLNVLPSDVNELADVIEEFEENTAILKQLEIRLEDVKRSLEKIEDGTYGICEVGDEAINPKRLEVNPAARTCIEHADEFESTRF